MQHQLVTVRSDLQREADTYLAYKRRRLTERSQGGYAATLAAFSRHFPTLGLADFEPPQGTVLIEDFLSDLWGELAARTYNKNLSVISDFFKWQVRRGNLLRDPTLTIERARTRAIHHTTFTDEQRARILAANPAPRDQIALRLLLDYGLRKGALRSVRFEHFDVQTRRIGDLHEGREGAPVAAARRPSLAAP